MGVSVYDNSGKKVLVAENFYTDMINLPLVTEKREIYSFPFGDCELVQLAFSGIYIVYGDMVMHESRKLHFEMEGHHDLVEMHFTLAGSGQLQNKLNGNVYQFKENRHNLHYTPVFNGTGEYARNKHYKFFEVHFTTQFFFELAENSSPQLIRFAEQIAANDMAELCKESLPITMAMHQCIRDVMNCKLTGGLKLLFLQSKCIELLAMQAQAYEDAFNQPTSFVCKSDYDKECIRYAKEYLLQHAMQPPSLIELARISGINEFKLKQGFKEMYDNTVFGYLSDYKLNEARERLLAGDGEIKQIADELGYSSVQHFSGAFRKKFGMPPGKLKR